MKRLYRNPEEAPYPNSTKTA